MFGSWLNGLVKRASTLLSRGRGERRCRPRLEQLEDRSVPATMTVVNNLPPTTLADTIMQYTNSTPFGATLAVYTVNPAPVAKFVNSSVQAGTFCNAQTIIGLNCGVVIGGFNVGILPQVFVNPNPNPTHDVVLSFHFIPHASVGKIRIVMASDEWFASLTVGAFPDQVGVYVNGIQKAYIAGAQMSPVNQTLGSPDVISNMGPLFPGAASPYEIDASAFTIPITLTFGVHPNQVNTLTFAETEFADINFPTWLFIEPVRFFQGPKIVTYNPYNWVYQPGSNAFLGLVTIENLGDTALVAPHALYVVLPGLPSGSTIVSAGGTVLPGTSTPAVLLPSKIINAGQVLQLQVLITDPYNLALPTFFTAKPVVVAV